MRLWANRGLLFLPLVFLFASPALADSCNNFSTFQCSNGTPNTARLGGGTASGQDVGFILTGTGQFSVFNTNGKAASDVILVAASPSKLSGTLNGTSFTSLAIFPEKGAMHAISESLEGLGFCNNDCQGLSFGFVDLHSGLAANSSLNVSISGLAPGTALYAMLVVNGQLKYITPNSEALIVEGNTTSVPEPASMTLFASGLIGLAGFARRKFKTASQI